MSLRIWLPLNGDLKNKGLDDVSATLTGAVAVNDSGKIGKCYQFGTGTGRITLPKTTMTDIKECSVAFWVNILGWQTNWDTFFQAGLGSTPWNNYYFGILRNQGNFLCFSICNGSTSSQGNYKSSNLTLETWYHLTFVYKEGHCLIYINGELDKDYTTTIVPNFSGINYVSIGQLGNASSYQTNCKMNDFRIYDHALSLKEVKEISKGLVLHYPLDNGGIGIKPNLINTALSINVPSNGSTTAIENGVKTNGLNIDTYFTLPLTTTLITGTSYTVSCWCKGIKEGDVLRFGVNGQNSGNNLTIKNGFNFITFTPTADVSNTLMFDDNNRTNLPKVELTYFKLEEGSVATDWLPSENDSRYNAIRPNLIDINTVTTGKYLLSNGNIGSDQGWVYTDYIRLSPNKTYIASGLSKGGANTYVVLYDSSKTMTRSLLLTANQNLEITTSSTEYYIRLSIRTYASELTTSAKFYLINEIYDCSGYENNGIINGELIVSSDTNKYNFSTYIPSATKITHPCPVDKINQEWTCAIWVKLDNTNQTQTLNSFNISNNIVHSADGYPLLYLNSGANDYYNYGNKKVVAGVWTHIAFVFKNSNATKLIYINGINQTNTNGPNKTSTPYGLSDTIDMCSNLSGYISDYRIYTTALSDEDILELYNTQASVDKNNNFYSYSYKELDQGNEIEYLYNLTRVSGSGTFVQDEDGLHLSQQIYVTHDYIPIDPTDKIYKYDIIYSCDAGNLLYIGWERYDADKTSRSNNACTYVISSQTERNYYRLRGTVNLSTDGVNPCAFIKLRILNKWTGSSSETTGTAIIHSLSLKEYTTTTTQNMTPLNISRQGITNTTEIQQKDIGVNINNVYELVSNNFYEY